MRTIITHPNPWGNGISVAWVYLPLWDGPLENYMREPYIIKYEDV